MPVLFQYENLMSNISLVLCDGNRSLPHHGSNGIHEDILSVYCKSLVQFNNKRNLQKKETYKRKKIKVLSKI